MGRYEWLLSHRFTNEGRLKHQWHQALNELDIHARLAKLRLVQQLLKHQTKFLDLWLPFLDSFLAPAHFSVLTEADVKEVERMGYFLSETSSEHHYVEEIWNRAIAAYWSIGADAQAQSLLTRMFYASSKSEWKGWSAWQLAESHASADEHLDIYIQYLQSSSTQTYSKQMLAILANVCNINFDSAAVHLKRAKKLSDRLIANGIHVSGKWKAGAFYTLIVKKQPLDAVELFIRALMDDDSDSDIFCGLVAASIQSDQFAYASTIAHAAKKFTSPIILGMVKLFTVLQWLNNQDDSKHPPCTVQDIEPLKNLDLQKYIGDKTDIVIGRLYLLEGNSQKAANILYSVATKHPEQQQWKYYLTWAALLANDHANLSHYLTSTTSIWTGRWTIASLVLDAAPTLTEWYLAFTQLENAIDVKHAYAQYIKARVALVRLHIPEVITSVMHNGSLEENMEALRIILACAFYRRDNALFAKLLILPLFYRLPIPDQDLWRGLYEFCTRNNTQGRALLEESYKNFGYQRVALILAVHYLEWNMLQEAKHYLDYVGIGRDNPKVTMLRAYIAEQEGDDQRAVEVYKKLLKQGETRAHYALGNFYLHQTKYKQAVEAFNLAQKEKFSTLPENYTTTALYTDFVVDPKSTDLWQKIETLESSQKPLWLRWNAFITRIWYGNLNDAVTTCNLITPMLEYSGVQKRL